MAKSKTPAADTTTTDATPADTTDKAAKAAKPRKPKVPSRDDAANTAIRTMEASATLTELAAAADALVVAAGGKSRPKASAWHVLRALKTAEALGLVELVRPTDVTVRRK